MEPKSKTKHLNIRKTMIWILLAVGFGAVEFPGILLVGHRIYPRILGLPFLYGYVLCCWIYLCCLFFYAYRTKWGKVSFFKKKAT